MRDGGLSQGAPRWSPAIRKHGDISRHARQAADSQFASRCASARQRAFVQGQFEEARSITGATSRTSRKADTPRKRSIATRWRRLPREFEPALPALNAYLQKYPQGAFAADAGYA